MDASPTLALFAPASLPGAGRLAAPVELDAPEAPPPAARPAAARSLDALCLCGGVGTVPVWPESESTLRRPFVVWSRQRIGRDGGPGAYVVLFVVEVHLSRDGMLPARAAQVPCPSCQDPSEAEGRTMIRVLARGRGEGGR